MSAPAAPTRLTRRLTAQLLAGARPRDPLAVAQRLLAIQGQDQRGARLAVRARSTGITAADVERELTEKRSLLITWLNRGTLHLVRSEDYALLHAVTTPPLVTSNVTRLAQEGVSPDEADRGVGVIERALADEGPLTGPVLRERLARAGVRTDGQAFIHVAFRASLLGRVIRGPMQGRRHAYALVRDWLGPQPAMDRERALTELARRYLAGHGPASDRDLARWAGIPVGQARVGLTGLAGELRELPEGLVDLAGRPPAARLPAPRLLGAFEPLLLGWTSRAEVLGEAESAVVSGGIFRGFALAGGRAVAGWRLTGGQVEIEPFAPLSDEVAGALGADSGELLRFLGLA